MSEGFFNRWSRRKQEAVQPPVPEAAAPMAESPKVPATAAAEPAAPVSTAAAQPLPTLDDVQALTPASDFQPFMRREVDAGVRNAAMKKLFADPHFNVMDGLDIYIDDYSQPDPMPAGMLRRMASAQFLGLAPQDPAHEKVAAEGDEVVAQSPDSSADAEPQTHDHPDLQLQPDPAPADPIAGSRPR